MKTNNEFESNGQRPQFTPERITSLRPNEVFVFGSNLAGAHAGGAARTAVRLFGAVWGQGVGMQGQSYAIPTMHGGPEAIKPYVDEFISFAKSHPEKLFYVTRIGCGIAGLKVSEIAPLFADALHFGNIVLPRDFVEAIKNSQKNDESSWDHEAFLAEYAKYWGDASQYNNIRGLRVTEYKNTIDLVRQGYYMADGKKVLLREGDWKASKGVFYSEEFDVRSIPAAGDSVVCVMNEDCLKLAKELKVRGLNPIVLNLANRQTPGGGVIRGAGAQEETIFRRTDLFRSLYQFAPFAEKYGLEHAEHTYPMDRNFGGIYSPKVKIFREDEAHGYKLMPEPVEVAVVTVAAINRPDLVSAEEMSAQHAEATKRKIRTILRIAIRHGHDSIVLGAFGCGAFCNPPSHVARLFHEVFEEPEFANKIKFIYFAILDDHNAHKAHNPRGNFIPFVEEFHK